jgi:phosphoglucosamine mutase
LFLGKTIVVGKDTRLSGDMLEAALCAGVMSAGGTALTTGVLPTPGVALLVRELAAAGGAVISASHNPPEYNGIKLFDSFGYKLPDEVEDKIEAFIVGSGLEGAANAGAGNAADEEICSMPVGGDLGIVVPLEDAAEIYIKHAVESLSAEGLDFAGLSVAVDVGHGASCVSTPEALRRLGAQVSVINEDFDGTDINVKCGSTHLEPLSQFMAECKADVGIAHDGDADRVMLMTPAGDVIDGDIVEAVCAIDMKRRGVLAGNTVVSTVMCNLGFVHAMEAEGIDVVKTAVGDRYVLEEMREHGYSIGGEQSGHMILLDYNSTGDGLMTAIQFLAAVKRLGISVQEAADMVVKYPQVLINVHVADKHTVADAPAVKEAIANVEGALGSDGRVLLRPSGTEPVVRVMVEAATQEVAQKYAEQLSAV